MEEQIKSNYIFKKIANNITKKQLFKIIKYNKSFQYKLDIGIIDYKNYYGQIEIELITATKEDKNNFINIKEGYESYYHIYFNNNKNEIKQTYFNKNENNNKNKNNNRF